MRYPRIRDLREDRDLKWTEVAVKDERRPEKTPLKKATQCKNALLFWCVYFFSTLSQSFKKRAMPALVRGWSIMPARTL